MEWIFHFNLTSNPVEYVFFFLINKQKIEVGIDCINCPTAEK